MLVSSTDVLRHRRNGPQTGDIHQDWPARQINHIWLIDI